MATPRHLPDVNHDFAHDLPHHEQHTASRHTTVTGGGGLGRASFTGGHRGFAPASAPGAPVALDEPRSPHYE